MIKPIVEDLDLIRSTRLEIHDRMEIVTDESNENKIEIYMLDETGQRVEGGTFDRNDFMNHILEFYNREF